MSRLRDVRQRLGRQFKEHKKTFILYFILRLLVAATLVLQLFNGEYENVFLCFLTLALFMVPEFVSLRFRIVLPDALEISILLFIFSAEILGEIRSFYTVFPFWDSVLHTVNGFLMAAIGFALADLLNRDERVSVWLSPFFTALIAFCFSMTIGVMWEFFEFGMDMLFGADMQKDFVVTTVNSVLLNPEGLNKAVHVTVENVMVNGEDWTALYGGYIDIGLIDTMKDLLVNFVGAVVFSVMGYFYIKNGRRKTDLAENFIPIVKSGR